MRFRPVPGNNNNKYWYNSRNRMVESNDRYVSRGIIISVLRHDEFNSIIILPKDVRHTPIYPRQCYRVDTIRYKRFLNNRFNEFFTVVKFYVYLCRSCMFYAYNLYHHSRVGAKIKNRV